jgi:hypothetical protein
MDEGDTFNVLDAFPLRSKNRPCLCFGNVAALVSAVEAGSEIPTCMMKKLRGEFQPHGGKRADSGRKATLPSSSRHVDLYLDDDTIEAAKKLGDGSISAGIQRIFSQSGVKDENHEPPQK